MSDEQINQEGGSNEGPSVEPVENSKGISKVAIVVVVLLIIAAIVVFARGGNEEGEDGSTELDSSEVLENKVGEEAMENNDGEPIDIEAMEVDGTVIDGGDGFDIDAMESQTKEFNVDGKNFEFSMGEIKVKKGDTVRINFTSTDGFHDWVVDEFSASTERVNTDGTSTVIFIADQSGTFEYYCSVGSHRALGMFGSLVVEE
jgi:plastocyanin